MSKEREAFEAWAEREMPLTYKRAILNDVSCAQETRELNFARKGYQAATAHYQPLLEAKDAEIAGLKNARIYTDNSKAAALLQVENTTLKALLEQASKTLNAAKRAINGREHTGFIDKTLAAINAATGKGE